MDESSNGDLNDSSANIARVRGSPSLVNPSGKCCGVCRNGDEAREEEELLKLSRSGVDIVRVG